MKVGFYLNNLNLPDIDYSEILVSNPGIGGSEYEFLLVSYLIEQRENDIDSYLLTNFKGRFPHENNIYVKNLKGSCDYCILHKIELLVIDIKYCDVEILELYDNKLSIIIWAHNHPSAILLDTVHRMKCIKKIVCCGREELEMYRDHLATLKSTYVYNIFPVRKKEFYKSFFRDKDSHNVVYMGSIVPMKGFHVLAQAWSDVLKRVPDANLYVIGSGKLYNNNAELGPYGIAEKEYEQTFIPYIIDGEGNLLPSVHFLGTLGSEKYDILGRCKVGVPNPTGASETFCISGIEMQLMGCSPTTIYHPAYLDTIYNKKYLYRKTTHLSKYIVNRLLDEPDDYNEIYNFVATNFGVDGNIEKWEYIFKYVDDDMVEPISKNMYQCKRLKNYLLKLKIYVPILRKIPTVSRAILCYKYWVAGKIMHKPIY